jgi:hypothetical protein
MIAHIAIVVGQAGSINSAAAPYAATALGVSEEVVSSAVSIAFRLR